MKTLRAVVPLLVAAVLAVIAVVAVQRAGCDDVGRYERSGDGYVLVGGCLAPGDVMVAVPSTPPVAAEGDVPVRS